MNQHQRSYAVERINTIVKEKILEINKKFITPAKKISSENKLDLIYSGKVKLIPRAEMRDYTHITSAFDFSKYECEERKDPQADTIIEKIKIITRNTKDAIMLAGDQEALTAIQDFEKIIFKL